MTENAAINLHKALVVPVIELLIRLFRGPCLLISRHTLAPPWLPGLVVATWGLGIFLHFVSDAQKYFALGSERALITDGLFARTRNPNYLGELLIYGAYGLLAQHWLPFVVLAVWTVAFFVPNMRAKDRSLSRYEGFGAYKARSGLLIPRLF